MFLCSYPLIMQIIGGFFYAELLQPVPKDKLIKDNSGI